MVNALVIKWVDADKLHEETVTVKMLEWAQQLADAGMPYGIQSVTPVWNLDMLKESVSWLT